VSELYINDLEGISLESIEKLANEEQKTYLGVWRDVERRALKKFTTSLTNYFRTKYRIKKLLDRYYFGQYVDPSDTAPAAAGFRGISVELNPHRTEAEISPFITMSVSRFQYYALADDDIEFQIIDPLSNEILWSEIVAVKSGQWNDVKAIFSVPALQFTRELRIGYVSTGVVSPKTSLSNDTSGECGCSIAGCCSARIKGIETSTLGVSYDTENSFGIRGFVSLQCSYEGLVCASRELFSTALWYYMGAEMMRERIHSSRLNKFTSINRKDAQELLDDFLDVYQNEMETVIDAVDLNESECCLECSAVVTYVETTL